MTAPPARAYAPLVVVNERPPPEALTRGRAYRPYGAALQAWFCRDPEVLLEGPKDTGKSRSLLELGHYLMKRYAGARGLLLRKTRTALTQSVLVTFEEKVLSERDRVDLRVDQVGRQNRTEYVYPNGSRLVVGGLDNPLASQSSEYDMIIGFEWIEATEHEHEMMSGLLRNGVMPFQLFFVDTNPGDPNHWLNLRANKGKITRFLARHSDNPSITPARLERLNRLTGVRRKRLKDGLWVAAEGMIYEGWDPAVHIVPRFTPPQGWRRWWVVDFGFTHPFVWQEWVEDGDGRLYLYREIYYTRRAVAEHAKRMLIATEGDPAPADIVCDHDASDRATLERSLAEGVWVTGPVGEGEECAPAASGARHLQLFKRTIAAHKAVRPGIEAVQGRMTVADDGQPRLMIMAGCLALRDPSLDDIESGKPPRPASTAEEIPTYVWDEGKDRPVKENDHGCDAVRYIVARVDRIDLDRPRGKKTTAADGDTSRGRKPELAGIRKEQW